MAAALPTEVFRQPILLKPVFSPRPWGGDALARLLQKTLPPDQGPIGESWELSDHPDGRSLVAGDSPAAGVPFGDLIRSNPSPMIGREKAPAKYPLLVKYIDATGDLSVQVHPDDAWCRAHNHPDRGKSECWYVIECQPNAHIIYGFRPGVTPEQARKALKTPRFRDLLDFRPVKQGDFIPVPPGTVHAMLAGTLICEIQQSSNTTFRLYDWDRQPPRPLHIEESFQIARFDPEPLPPFLSLGPLPQKPEGAPIQWRPIHRNEFFQVTLCQATPASRAEFAEQLISPTGSILSIVTGSGRLHGKNWQRPLRPGQTYFLPAAMDPPALETTHDAIRLLVTTSREI